MTKIQNKLDFLTTLIPNIRINVYIFIPNTNQAKKKIGIHYIKKYIIVSRKKGRAYIVILINLKMINVSMVDMYSNVLEVGNTVMVCQKPRKNYKMLI